MPKSRQAYPTDLNDTGWSITAPYFPEEQLTGALLAHLEWWRAYYHFCRPHLALRLTLVVPQARRGKQTPRRYGPRFPAMAAGLTDHLRSVEELLVFPVGQ